MCCEALGGSDPPRYISAASLRSEPAREANSTNAVGLGAPFKREAGYCLYSTSFSCCRSKSGAEGSGPWFARPATVKFSPAAGKDQQRKSGTDLLVTDANVASFVERHGFLLAQCDHVRCNGSAQFSYLLNSVGHCSPRSAARSRDRASIGPPQCASRAGAAGSRSGCSQVDVGKTLALSRKPISPRPC